MPIGPKGQRRPADVIGNAIEVARIATGEKSALRSAQIKGGRARKLVVNAIDRLLRATKEPRCEKIAK
jgi:hypothetical protein